jgi:hypothetical protein
MANYTAVNHQSVAAVAGQMADPREIQWKWSVHTLARFSNPYDMLTGGFHGARPIKQILSTTQMHGTRVVFTRPARLGARGYSGTGTYVGTEEKRVFGQYELNFGHHFFGVSEEDMASDQTVVGLGGKFDQAVMPLLADRLRMHDRDTLEATALAGAHALNTVYPNSKSGVNALGTADYISHTSITQFKNQAPAANVRAINVARHQEQVISKHFVCGSQYALGNLMQSASFQGIISNAGVRGGDNELFGGHLPEWDGCRLHKFEVEDDDADGPKGSFFAPRAYLGVAIAANNTAPVIYGGGITGNSARSASAAAKTDVGYFQAFPGAPYAANGRTIIPQETSANKHVMIQNMSGADVMKFGFYTYTTTDGNTITTTERLRASASGDAVTTLTGSTITWNTAPWLAAASGSYTGLTDAHPVGSLIVPVNTKGVYYVRSLVIGEDFLMTGFGTIDGTASTALGKRVTESQNYGAFAGIGLRRVFGMDVIKNSYGLANGYMLVTSAFKLPGMPDII